MILTSLTASDVTSPALFIFFPLTIDSFLAFYLSSPSSSRPPASRSRPRRSCSALCFHLGGNERHKQEEVARYPYRTNCSRPVGAADEGEQMKRRRGAARALSQTLNETKTRRCGRLGLKWCKNKTLDGSERSSWASRIFFIFLHWIQFAKKCIGTF